MSVFGRCLICQADLTREERRFYEDHCEECEKDWQSRIDAWLKGGDDPELEALYGGLADPKPVCH